MFAEFTKSYGITHQTSSLRYPQGNGEAEHTVKTVKSILNKSEDPYLGLLACRTTAIQNGYSPSQLLMGRTLRSTIPQLQTHFVPQLPNPAQLREKEQKAKQQQKNFDYCHKSRNLKPLKEGETVWMSDRKESGTVTRKVAPRSYLVQTFEGEYRRNRKCLIPLSATMPTLNNRLPDEEP